MVRNIITIICTPCCTLYNVICILRGPITSGMASVSFHLKDPSADKPTAIFIWLNGDGQRVRIYTGEKIHPGQWDKGEQKAKTRGRGIDSNNGTINTSLKNMGERLLRFYGEQRAARIIPSPESLRDVAEPQPEVNEERPMPLVDLLEYRSRHALIRRPNTTKALLTTYNHLLAYQAKVGSLSYDSFTLSFHDRFTAYLLQDVGLADNSIGKMITCLKQFLADAVDRGRTSRQDFKRWKWAHRDPDILALSRSELRAIEEAEVSDSRYLRNARALFLLSCYTGLRFSDVALLKPEHDKGDRLQLTTQKTSDKLTIPLHPKARPLLEDLWAGKVRPISNQKLNKYLKDLAQLAGLTTPVERNTYRGGHRNTETKAKYEVISSHTGRRTFVTLALESGLPWEIVMKATGHKDFKSFRRYIHATEERQVNEFARVWADQKEN